MLLDMVVQVGPQDGYAEGSAQLPREIDQAGGLLRLLRIDAGIDCIVDRCKEKAEAESPDQERKTNLRLAGQSSQVSQLPHRSDENGYSNEDQYACIHERLWAVEQ